MADLAGYATCIFLSVLALNLWPELRAPVWVQAAVAGVACVINFVVWRRSAIPPMSARSVAKTIAFVFCILLLMATVDCVIGFTNGQKTLAHAFLNSGPLGGIMDIVLATIAVLIGLPVAVRSLILYYGPSRP